MRRLLVAMVVGCTLLVPARAEAAQRSLPGWWPPAVKQAGSTCTINATSWAASWWMAQRYGWRHPITLLGGAGAYLARADARGPERRMTKVAHDAASPGYVFAQHPSARIRVQSRPVGDYLEARKALDLRQPVVVALMVPYGAPSPWDGSEAANSGHAVALVQYDAWGFRFVNSWGSSWGVAGYGDISYEAYERWRYQQAFAVTGVTVSPR